MSKPEHTPGPWNVAEDWNTTDSGNLEVLGGETNEAIICAIWPHGESELSTDCAEAVANAQLIAAAPELLAACRQIVWKLSHYFHDSTVFNSDGSICGTYTGPALLDKNDAVIKLVERAIAKATGSET